jgi:hypothetical protein
MFTKLGPNSVKSDEGFTVSIAKRYELEYRTEGKRVLVEIEGGDGLAVYESSIEWWETEGDKEYVSKEERAQIIKNICDALTFLKIKYVIE